MQTLLKTLAALTNQSINVRVPLTGRRFYLHVRSAVGAGGCGEGPGLYLRYVGATLSLIPPSLFVGAGLLSVELGIY